MKYSAPTTLPPIPRETKIGYIAMKYYTVLESKSYPDMPPGSPVALPSPLITPYHMPSEPCCI